MQIPMIFLMEETMNHLNSVLIEGCLDGMPKLTTPTNSDPVCIFRLASMRFDKTNSQIGKHISIFSVRTIGKLAETCSQNLTKGRGIRVVGRIEQDDDAFLIVAEHIEFKPESR